MFIWNSKKCKQRNIRSVRLCFYWNVGLRYKGQERSRKKKREEILRSDGYVSYLDYSDSSTGICICQNLSILGFKFMQFIVCQLYINEATKIFSILAIFHINCLHAPFQ